METAGWVVACWKKRASKVSHLQTLDRSYVLMGKIKPVLRCRNVICKTNEGSLFAGAGSGATRAALAPQSSATSGGGDGRGQSEHFNRLLKAWKHPRGKPSGAKAGLPSPVPHPRGHAAGPCPASRPATAGVSVLHSLSAASEPAGNGPILFSPYRGSALASPAP